MTKETIKLLGERFKERRQEMNYSLKDVENATSIRISFLQAIEEGQKQKLISPVYAQGFVRQYAIFLGMDPDALLRELPLNFTAGLPQEFSYGIGTLEVRANSTSGVRWIPNTVWIGLFGAVLLAAWYCARYFEVL